VGELVVGKPVFQLEFPVSLPLDLVSAMSLLYRAVPGSGLDPWLVATRRALPEELRADLDLLHGFSGRLLYYMEEPALRFEPLRSDRLGTDFGAFAAFLGELAPSVYGEMALDALRRVHRDLGEPFAPPAAGDAAAWRRAIQPGLTTADADAAVGLILDNAELKRRTVGLIRGIWEHVYAAEFASCLPTLREAARLARSVAPRGFGLAFADLTGSRLPSTLLTGVGDVRRVAFCPSAHLGSFVSYILHPPDLIIYFDAPNWLERTSGEPVEAAEARRAANVPRESGATALPTVDLLDGLRALADPNRLQIIDLLEGGELYAQEIVGRLGIAQSAVSRHLALLERAGLLVVEPRRGMKYYRVSGERLDALGAAIARRGGPDGVGARPPEDSPVVPETAIVPDTGSKTGSVAQNML
jgi:DNA-binding transcriptional ArsR family regulator